MSYAAETTCPKCSAYLDNENLRHDGYLGSPYAHAGAGSYGLARHHYYFVCDCGWVEPHQKQERRNHNGGRGTQKYDGLVLPKNATSLLDCVRLSCHSRHTKLEKRIVRLLWEKSSKGEAHSDFGHITGHSLCSSYRYVLVTKAFFSAVEVLGKCGQEGGGR